MSDMTDHISTDPLATQLLQVAHDFRGELPLAQVQTLRDAAAKLHRQHIDRMAQALDQGTPAAPPAAAPRDWAEARARQAVDPYRSLFRPDAAASAGGLINVIAGELRAAEDTARRSAVEAGEQMLAKLKALRAT